MINKILEITIKYAKQFADFADEYADKLNEPAKVKCQNLIIKEFNQEVDQSRKREAFLRSSANKLFKASIKAMKEELKAKALKRKQELKKLGLMTQLYGDIVLKDESNKCSTCTHCCQLKHDEYSTVKTFCRAHGIEFENDELREQFCKCFCTSYEQQTTEEEKTCEIEEIDDDEIIAEEVEDSSQEVEEQETCEKCSSFFKDENGVCYCNKYCEYLDESTVTEERCCESADFFDDDEDEEE